jgi:hypothetical protein
VCIYVYIHIYNLVPYLTHFHHQQQASASSSPLQREEGKEEEAFPHQFMETEVYVDVGMVL